MIGKLFCFLKNLTFSDQNQNPRPLNDSYRDYGFCFFGFYNQKVFSNLPQPDSKYSCVKC